MVTCYDKSTSDELIFVQRLISDYYIRARSTGMGGEGGELVAHDGIGLELGTSHVKREYANRFGLVSARVWAKPQESSVVGTN